MVMTRAVFLLGPIKSVVALFGLVATIALMYPCASAEENAWQSLSSGIPGQTGISAIATSPACPDVIYMSTDSPGGLYLSTDGGLRWNNIGNGLANVGVVSLAVHPSQPFAVYAGTVNGLYRTAGSGQTEQTCLDAGSFEWEPVSGLNASHIYAVLITPGPSGRIFVGSEEGLFLTDDGQDWRQVANVTQPVLSLAQSVGGSIFAGTVGQGLLASDDDGQTWRNIGEPFTKGAVLSVRATLDKRLYCWVGNRLLVSHSVTSSSGPQDQNNVFSSQWQEIDLPDNWEPFCFAVGGGAPQHLNLGQAHRLYVGSRNKGILVSNNFDLSASNWRHVAHSLANADVTCLEVHPDDPNVAFAGTKFHGLYRTADGGTTWQHVSAETGRPSVLALAQHPAQPPELYAGTIGGLYKTSNAGQDWQPLTDQLGKLIVQGIAIGSSPPWPLYIATHIGVFVSVDDGRSWRWATQTLGKIHTFNIAIAPASSIDGRTTLYAGSWGNNLLRSVDNGQTWSPVHNGLETLSVYAFVQHPSQLNTLWVGTVERVYKSRDSGSSWTAVNRGMREGITIFAFAVDKQHPARLYAGTTAGIYRSENEGDEWTLLTDEKLAVTINALLIHPNNPNILYAGTEHDGLYVSTDFGRHWSRLAFPQASIYAILIDRGDFIWLGTDRGVFRKRLTF